MKLHRLLANGKGSNVYVDPEAMKALGARVGDYVYWIIDSGKVQLRKATIT